ncbi:hypothetical protein HS7_21300 [Sulfolobales archaeon HS-7]|nr:hypothetical protein HS7_21300 [Sulfolobales archaeon HS-7]
MISYDLILIPAFILSAVVGKKWRVKLDQKVISVIVMVLIATISAWGGNTIPLNEILTVLLLSTLYCVVTIAVTYAVGTAFVRGNSRRLKSINLSSLKYGGIVLIAWPIGFLLKSLTIPFDNLISGELLILIVLVGLTTSENISLKGLIRHGRNGLIASGISIIGSLISGILLSLFLDIRMPVSLTITLGMGWYTFTGPLIASATGSVTLGILGFIANFLREQLTFILVPIIPGDPRTLISIGGATTMDDTLAIYTSSLGSDSTLPALINGVVLTILIPILLPLIISF